MSAYCRCVVHSVQHTHTSTQDSRNDTFVPIGVDNNGAHHQSSSLKSIINNNSTAINLTELYLSLSATLCPQYTLCYAVNCVLRRFFLSLFNGMKKKNIRKFNVVSDRAAMRGRERGRYVPQSYEVGHGSRTITRWFAYISFRSPSIPFGWRDCSVSSTNQKRTNVASVCK